MNRTAAAVAVRPAGLRCRLRLPGPGAGGGGDPGRQQRQGRRGRHRLSARTGAARGQARRHPPRGADGADEIDMVIDRGAFLSGDFDAVYDEIGAVKQACGDAHLKVILETGELVTFDNVRRASELALQAGADFIKTSTGKIQPAATPGVVLVMLEAIRDFYLATGRRIGMKPAGGIRTSKQALHLLVMVKETLGDAWLTPELFRIGASTLTNDLLIQLAKEATGRYQSGDYFSNY